MPQEYDEITRAIQEAKAKVDRRYEGAPSKPDLVASYDLTESEIDGLREDLNERLSRSGREVLKLDRVYFEHLRQALQAQAGQRSTVQDDQWRERLLTDVRDRIEQGPANMLADEVAKQGPREFLEALLDCLEEVYEPVQPGGEPETSARTPPAGAVQPSGTASPTSTPPPDVRRPTMPDRCEAPGDRMRTSEELGSITVKIHFPYGARTITATDDSMATNPEHLEDEAAVAHLLRVDMRGDLETGIQEEARKALGIEDVKVELLAVNQRQSVELVLAVIGLAATLVKDAPEIMEGFDRLFQGSLNVVRRVLQRMRRPGPVPAHVVTGFWTPGAALERMQREPAAQPATPEAGRVPARVEPPAGEARAQPDTDRIAPSRLSMPSLLLSIYLLIVNVALIATLIVLVFWQR